MSLINYFKNLESGTRTNIIIMLCLVLFIALPDLASASGSADAITNTLCNIVKKLTGPIGKGIATIAIVVLAIGLFVGKLSWALFIATSVGIGMIFGAQGIVNMLSPTSGSDPCAATS